MSDANKQLGLQGGDIISNGALTEKNYSCAQAIGEVTITSIVQPDFNPPNGQDGDIILDGFFIYGAITAITFTGKLKLYKNHLRNS